LQNPPADPNPAECARAVTWDANSASLALALSVTGLGVSREDLRTGLAVLDANFERILGIDRSTRPRTASHSQDCVHPEDREAFLDHRRRSIAGEVLPPVELRMLRPDGEVRHVLLQRVLEQEGAGPADHMVTVMYDVTEQRLAAQARSARRAAEEANRAKSEFLSRMSHDLRTPLNAILGFTDLMLNSDRNALAAEQREQLQHIDRAGQHLLRTINDLLDLSRIEIGTLQIRPCDTDAVAAVRSATGALLGDAAARSVTVTMSLPASPLPVHADPERLQQVVFNLVSNAIKYNRRGGSVTVALDAAAGTARLVVSDTGLGMTAEQIGLLFQPFGRPQRADLGMRGTGIGLAITYHLVLAMGGGIDVDSTPGVGSRFSVVWPLLQPQA